MHSNSNGQTGYPRNSDAFAHMSDFRLPFHLDRSTFLPATSAVLYCIVYFFPVSFSQTLPCFPIQHLDITSHSRIGDRFLQRETQLASPL